MIGQELRIEQLKTGASEVVDGKGQGHFRPVRRAAEHALSEKCASKRNSVHAADQNIVLSNVERMGMTHPMKVQHQVPDRVVDPCLGAVGASLQYRFEIPVQCRHDPTPPHAPRQGTRHVKPVQGQDATPSRIDPEDIRIVAPFGHGKDARRIRSQQQFRRQFSIAHKVSLQDRRYRRYCRFSSSHFSSQWIL